MSSDYFRQYRAGLKSPIPAAAFSFCQISGFGQKGNADNRKKVLLRPDTA
jgi:hypothetical protein